MESIEVVAQTFDGSGQFGGRNPGFGGHCCLLPPARPAAAYHPRRSVEHHDHTRIGWLASPNWAAVLPTVHHLDGHSTRCRCPGWRCRPLPRRSPGRFPRGCRVRITRCQALADPLRHRAMPQAASTAGRSRSHLVRSTLNAHPLAGSVRLSSDCDSTHQHRATN